MSDKNSEYYSIDEPIIVPITSPGKPDGYHNTIAKANSCNIYEDNNNEIDEDATSLIEELNRMTDCSNDMHNLQEEDEEEDETLDFGNIFIKYPGPSGDCLDNVTVVSEEPSTIESIETTETEPTHHGNSSQNQSTDTNKNEESDTVNIINDTKYFDLDINTTDYIVIENNNGKIMEPDNENIHDNNNNDVVEDKKCISEDDIVVVVRADEYDIPEFPSLNLHNEIRCTKEVALQSEGEVIIINTSKRQNSYNIFGDNFRSEAFVNIVCKEYYPMLTSTTSLLDLSDQKFTMADEPALTRSSSLIELSSQTFITKGRFVSVTVRRRALNGVEHSITKRQWCYVLRNSEQSAANKQSKFNARRNRKRSCQISFTVIEDPATINRWEITTFELLNKAREKVLSESEWVLIDCTSDEIELFNAHQNELLEFSAKHNKLLTYKREEAR